jgi:hypothetical protein
MTREKNKPSYFVNQAGGTTILEKKKLVYPLGEETVEGTP